MGLTAMAALLGILLWPGYAPAQPRILAEVRGANGFHLMVMNGDIRQVKKVAPAVAAPGAKSNVAGVAAAFVPGQTPTLSATGTPHSVTLEWNAGTQASNFTLVGFDAYRALASQAELGTLALNGGTPITTQFSVGCSVTVTNSCCLSGLAVPCYAFVDNTVVAATPYFYEVDTQATNSQTTPAGQLQFSGPSNELSITVPANPPAPQLPAAGIKAQ
jgi:hypothetical protein